MAEHSGLAAGRWFTFSLAEQLGNIGSEVGRALRAVTGEEKRAAGVRALELFDLTLSDSRWYGRGSELARSREVVSDLLFGNNIYNVSELSLENYFTQFALLARRDR